MADTDRRSFLKLMGAGALAASVPPSIRKALAVPARRRTGTIKDVEHIVILMQENRSFDHYFGTLRGVRGFNDPHVALQPNGKPVWNQAYAGGELLPFRPDVPDVGMAFLPDPPHGWNDTHAAWNGGRHDQWVPNKGLDTMTYHTRADLPFQYALADAFTICDSYHCSLLGPTDPNRYHLWTGWVGNDGNGGGPVITNDEAGYDWSTYPERLERAGISWKVYQDIGHGLDAAGSWGWTGDAPYIGNYGDNSLLYFHQYQNALPGNPLADKAKTGTHIEVGGTLFDQFRADVERGQLPQVSWIVAPEAYTEHPNWAPDYGAWYVSQMLDILASHPEVWSTTVLLLNYDEEGGFFDHVVPPTPPAGPGPAFGASTVATTNELYPGSAAHPAGPYGLGMRVPLIVASPWSRGGWVNSQLFDHTSVIKFLEARFADEHRGLIETNITPWRRAVTGDLTSAFDFENPNTQLPKLPDTSSFAPKDRVRHPDLVVVPPANPALPQQEKGVRRARALPYELDAVASAGVRSGDLELEFRNTGRATAVFLTRSAATTDPPRTYTVEPHKKLKGTWSPSGGDQAYDVAVHGPNGFYRRAAGRLAPGAANLAVTATPARSGDLLLKITNVGDRAVTVAIGDVYTGQPVTRRLAPHQSFQRPCWLQKAYGWYDVTITVAEDATFERRLAGHVEDGHDSVSDPAMGGLLG